MGVVCVVAVVQDVRRKVARVVASKCTLASRVDSFHESPGGDIGESKRQHKILTFSLSYPF